MIYFMVMFYVLVSMISSIFSETIINMGSAKMHVRESTSIYVAMCILLWDTVPLLLTIIVSDARTYDLAMDKALAMF